MDKTTYQKYLETDCWQLRRDTYIRRFEVCELCGHNKSTQVHHLTYERLGHELDSDLVATCDGCHKAVHGLTGGTPIEWIQQFVETSMGFAAPTYQQKYCVILRAIEALKGVAA